MGHNLKDTYYITLLHISKYLNTIYRENIVFEVSKSLSRYRSPAKVLQQLAMVWSLTVCHSYTECGQNLEPNITHTQEYLIQTERSANRHVPFWKLLQLNSIHAKCNVRDQLASRRNYATRLRSANNVEKRRLSSSWQKHHEDNDRNIWVALKRDQALQIMLGRML